MSQRPARRTPSPLPLRDGVAASYVWLPEGEWPDLLAFLLSRFPQVSEATWLQRMARGEVVDAQGTLLAPHSAFRRGQQIFYYRELEQETPIPFQETILFQDAHLLVVDKPHFLPVIPSGRFLQETLLVRLKKRFDMPHLTPIHRLDRETAGVVVFSHCLESRGAYQALFQQRAVDKVYEALAPSPQAAGVTLTFPLLRTSRIEQGEPFFTMREVAGEANAETRLEILAEYGALNLYRLLPRTGRTHQLRVHMAALGLPIVNDAFYPVALPCKGDDVSQPLQLLARSLAFDDPLTGARREFVSQRQLLNHPFSKSNPP